MEQPRKSLPIQRLVALMARLDDPQEGATALMHCNRLLNAHGLTWRDMLIHVEQSIKTFGFVQTVGVKRSEINQGQSGDRHSYERCPSFNIPKNVSGHYEVEKETSIGGRMGVIWDVKVYDDNRRTFYELTISNQNDIHLLRNSGSTYVSGRVSSSSPDERPVLFCDRR